jgi:mRNA interferase HigB
MRIIARKRLEEFWSKHRDAQTWLTNWYQVTQAAEWNSLADVRRSFLTADPVTVRSGNSATVFNVCGNKYRLVVAIHYNTKMVFVLRIMTHAEYSKDTWKDSL